MNQLSQKQLDDLSQFLIVNGRDLSDAGIQKIKNYLTAILFNGCDSTIIRQFVASNKKTRVGNKFWGLLRSIQLDKKMNRSQLRYVLQLIIVE